MIKKIQERSKINLIKIEIKTILKRKKLNIVVNIWKYKKKKNGKIRWWEIEKWE